MSIETAPYLLNELDSELPSGTLLKGDGKSIITRLTSEETILTTTGTLRGIEDLQGFGLIVKPTLNYISSNFAVTSFTSSDGSVIINNVDGTIGSPSFALAPDKTVQKIKVAYKNGDTSVDLPMRSTINFINGEGLTISAEKNFTNNAYNVAISSLEVDKKIVSEIIAGSEDTLLFTANIVEDELRIVYGSSFSSVPTTAGILTCTNNNVEASPPNPYIQSLTIEMDPSAEDVFYVTPSPMAIGVPSSPKDEVTVEIGFNTTGASAGNTIGWDAGNNKAIWQAIGSSGITSVGFEVAPSFSSILQSPTPDVLTANGTFTFEYNTDGIVSNQIYTPRYLNASNGYVWSNFIESFTMSVDPTMSDILSIPPVLNTFTATFDINITTPPGANRTIEFDGTKFIWGTIDLGNMTSIGLSGANRIVQSNATPVTTGAANFSVGIDLAGATTGQTLVAATDQVGWGSASFFVGQQPYVIAQGEALCSVYISGSGVFTRNGTPIIPIPIPGGTAANYRGFAWGATRGVGLGPAEYPQQLYIYDALDGSGNLQIQVANRGNGSTTLNKRVQYIIYRVS